MLHSLQGSGTSIPTRCFLRGCAVNQIAIPEARITAMSEYAIDNVRRLEDVTVTMPQEDITTWHILHGDMYARTIKIPAGTLLTGALIKVPTLLIVNGDVTVYANETEMRIVGHRILPASGNRKQAFIAHQDTDLTMIFTSMAGSIEEAEEEFTDEADRLMSRSEGAINFVTITGE